MEPTQTKPHLKIVSLTAQNIKKIKAVHIEPSNNVVLLTGPNGAGKSSVLDSIMYALGGKKAIPDKPIREGESTASIKLDLGEIVVTRTFTPTNSYLEVHSKDGFKAKSPQSLLDKLVGHVSFDPLEFINDPDPKHQRQTLLRLAGLDFTDLDQQCSKIYEDRRVQGRLLTEARARAEALKPNVPAENLQPPIDIDILNREFQEALALAGEATKLQLEKDDASRQLSQLTASHQQIQDQITALQTEMAEITKKIAEAKLTVDNLSAQINNRPALPDPSTIAVKIEQAQKNNALIGQVAQYKEALASVGAYEEERQKLTQDLYGIETDKAKMLREAKMPIAGLSVSEDGVLYNGIPLSQISQGEALRIGVAVSMALNPTLRVLRITDGSLLDSDNFRVISDMVHNNDYQIWIEKVDETGKIGLYIEDGELKDSLITTGKEPTDG